MSRLKFFIFIILLSFSLIFADEECGKVKVGTSFSIGGVYSELGQWPWLASLHKEGKFWCGASIISKKHLLGAAHCVHPKGFDLIPVEDFHALLGAHDLNKNESDSVKVLISEIFVHFNWDADVNNPRYDADIAVYLMASEVEFTTLIQPICLPKPHAKIFDVDGTVVGYGLSETSQPHENVPKHVEIKSVEFEVCLFTDPLLSQYGSTRMFCAGDKGKNPCRGDSGGPFMVQEDDHWLINGIVSVAAHGECDENDFVLFTRVPLFLDWINEKIEGGHGVTQAGQNLTDQQQEIGRELLQPIVLECKFRNYRERCNLKVLEPNLKVTSIKLLDETLNFDEIDEIQIERAKVHYLPDFSIVQKKFPKYEKLKIESSGLKELDRSKLALLPQLTELNVYGNEIKELPEHVFDDLINMEKLGFAGNQVKTLPQKLLWKLPKLREFSAWGNKIEAIPAEFFDNNKNLLAIWLYDNEISRIAIDVRSMPNLIAFWLYGNQCISKDFRQDGKFESLTTKDQLQKIIEEKCQTKNWFSVFKALIYLSDVSKLKLKS